MTPHDYHKATPRGGDSPSLRHALESVQDWLNREITRSEKHEDTEAVEYLLKCHQMLSCIWVWTNGGERQLKLPY